MTMSRNCNLLTLYILHAQICCCCYANISIEKDCTGPAFIKNTSSPKSHFGTGLYTILLFLSYTKIPQTEQAETSTTFILLIKIPFFCVDPRKAVGGHWREFCPGLKTATTLIRLNNCGLIWVIFHFILYDWINCYSAWNHPKSDAIYLFHQDETIKMLPLWFQIVIYMCSKERKRWYFQAVADPWIPHKQLISSGNLI